MGIVPENKVLVWPSGLQCYLSSQGPLAPHLIGHRTLGAATCLATCNHNVVSRAETRLREAVSP